MVQDTIREFWTWFSNQESMLRNYDPVKGGYEPLQKLGEQLRKVDPDLTFELGSANAERRELTISANGVRELIPVVEQLLDQKPQFDHWQIVGFRQRKQLEGGMLSVRDFHISPLEVDCVLKSSLRRIDISLFAENYRPEDYYSWLEIAFLLLDAAIGEIDVATKVGEVTIIDKEKLSDTNAFPLTELPQRFDRYADELANHYATFDNSSDEERRVISFEKVSEVLSLQAAELDQDGGFIGESVCLELYFREVKNFDGQALIDELRTQCGMFVERIELGSVNGGANWIHGWFDQPRNILSNISETIQQIAERGYKHNCDLEAAFVSPAEDNSMLDSLFGSLELVPGSQSAMYAHQEIESGNIDNAITILEEALEEDCENLELRGLLAYSYAKKNDADLAEECLDELRSDLQGDTENPATFWNIACAYALLQDAKRACESLSIAFELDPALREVAIMDPDLAPLKGEPDFDKLVYQA